MSFNKNLLQKHPIIKTYLQWQKKELETTTKQKALEILEPYVNKVVEETKFNDEQKEQVINTLNQQSNIYKKHKELINEVI
jgi:DNA-binding protein H-NS